MKSRRRLLKSGVTAACVLGCLLIAYGYWGLCPGRLNAWACETAGKWCQKKISFKKALYIPFEGLVLSKLRVDELDGTPLFSAQEASLRIRWLPLLRENKIVIARVGLQSPVYDGLVYPNKPSQAATPAKTVYSGAFTPPSVEQAGPLNLRTIEYGPEAMLPENVYLEQIVISDGLVVVRDRSTKAVLEVVHAIQMRLGFKNPPNLLFGGSFKVGKDNEAAIAFNGRWDLEQERYDFLLSIRATQVPPWFSEHPIGSRIHLRRGRTAATVRLRNVDQSRSLFNAEAELEDALITAGSATAAGKIRVEAKGLYDFDAQRFDRYIGQAKITDATLGNFSKNVSRLDRVNGTISFQPDLLRVEALSGIFKEASFEAEGEIRSFSSPTLKGSVRFSLGIPQLIALLGDEQKKLISDYELTGRCRALTRITGPLDGPYQTESFLTIEEGSLAARQGQWALRDLECELRINEKGLTISHASFLCANRPYRLDAFLPKVEEALGHATLKTGPLTLSADFRKEEDSLTLKKGRLECPGGTAQFTGKVTHLKEPWLDLQGQLETNLKTLSKTLLHFGISCEKAGLTGSLRGAFALIGPARNPLKWELKIDASGSPVRFLNKLLLEAFEIQIRMKNHILGVPYIHARAYQGNVGANLSLDLARPFIPFNGRLYAHQIDLQDLSRDFFPHRDLVGRAVFSSLFEGRWSDPQSITGKGAIEVRDGSLWTTSLFKAMGQLPFVRVEGLDQVTFKRLGATFDIRQQRFWSDDLTLQSETVDLSLDGWLGWDQTMDFVMDIRYSENVFLGAFDSGGLAPFMIQEAARLISQYRIRGTLSNPRYEKMLISPGRTIGKKIGKALQRLA